MARAKASVVTPTLTAPTNILDPRVELPPQRTKNCGNCMHWRPRMYTTFFGECSRSQGSGPSMLVTTDLTTCGGHDFAR